MALAEAMPAGVDVDPDTLQEEKTGTPGDGNSSPKPVPTLNKSNTLKLQRRWGPPPPPVRLPDTLGAKRSNKY